MIRVGVKLPAATGRIGDYLADVTALEAAGADSVWVDAREAAEIEPWILLGAIAAVTHRLRLGTMIEAGEWPAAVDTLARLSGGRVIVSVPVGSGRRRPPGSPPTRILVTCDSGASLSHAADLADGVILPASEQEVRELRAKRSRDDGFELWVDARVPSDRAGWANMTAAIEAAGATGIIVSWDPRLIDLLRSAGEPDDRTDLLIATG